MYIILLILLFIWTLWSFYIFKRDSKYGISFRLMFSLWFGLAYIIVPIIYKIIEIFSGLHSVHPWFFYYVNNISWVIYGFIVLIAYVAYELGFHISGYIKFPNFRINSKRYYVDTSNTSLTAGYTLFILGLIGYIGFIYSYGVDIVFSQNIRYESLNIETNYLGTLFLYLRLLSFIGLLIILCSRFSGKSNVRFIFVVFTFIVVIYTSIQGASRGYFLYLGIIPFLCYYIIRRRAPIYWLTLLAVLFPIIIVFGRTILAFYALSDPGAAIEQLSLALKDVDVTVLFANITHTFAHPFASVPTAIDNTGISNYRFFYDIPLAALFYAKAFGIDFGYSVTYDHTFFLSGEYLSNIPPGIIASGIYQFGILGVFIWLFLFGVFSRLIQDKLYSLCKRNIAYLSIYTYFGFSLGNFVMNGDPRVYFVSTMILLFAFFVIALVERLRWRRS